MTPEQQKRLGKLLAMGIPLPLALPIALDPKRAAEETMTALEAVNVGISTAQDIAGDLITGKKPVQKRKIKSKATKAYSRAFKEVQKKYKLRNGKWKKDGFKKAVKEAHKLKRRYM